MAANVNHESTVHADEASYWDKLAAYFPIKRVNQKEAFSKDGACTNQAESFFSRLRRAEIGIHHRSPVVTSTRMPSKWHGVKITAAKQTVLSSQWQ
ncbi:possible transposase [Stappia aggregata IAM 12614]|uniref:Possible transposase n=1 Tax=Roseibium aggregatum (strain ATCC 25650 / DSM 13394 / JCM 20685 / NBRC 16684 / NCIMB 2208 / IAM 12614 / B1) TaxID=384765 RepID=A0NWY6_ROSAI|nr:possible transposase [Stappia aggregata IAM 12614] [Roseibium aggregatum IAM 12614]